MITTVTTGLLSFDHDDRSIHGSLSFDHDKYKSFVSARLCTKPYIARWVEDTNLIFVMAASSCDCFADEMPFNTKPKEVNYILYRKK